MAPVFRDLGSLAGEVKNAETGMDYVGTQGFKGFEKEPISVGSLIGVEGFEGSFLE